MNTSRELDSIADRLQGWLDDQVLRYGEDGVRDDMLIMNPIITRGEIKEIITVLSEASSQLENTVTPSQRQLGKEEISKIVIEFMAAAAVYRTLTDQQTDDLFDMIKTTLKSLCGKGFEISEARIDSEVDRFSAIVQFSKEPVNDGSKTEQILNMLFKGDD